MPGLQNMPNKGRTAVILFGEEDKDGDRELSRDDADITFQTSDTDGKDMYIHSLYLTVIFLEITHERHP